MQLFVTVQNKSNILLSTCNTLIDTRLQFLVCNIQTRIEYIYLHIKYLKKVGNSTELDSSTDYYCKATTDEMQ